MNNYGLNHLYYYQDFLFFAKEQSLKMLMVELRNLESKRLALLENNKDIYHYNREESVSTHLNLLRYKLSFHLFYLKLHSEKNHDLIRLEEEMLLKLKAYIYVHDMRPAHYLFGKYCLERVSTPLNDALLYIVKITMTAVYFLTGWLGWLKKCIR